MKVNVGAWKHPDLRGAESMPVGYCEDGAVAFVFDGREKAPHFILGEVGDGLVLPSLV